MKSRLFFFNPTNEMAIANGEVSYMPPRNLYRFEHDLATFPWMLGGNNDFVLVREKVGNSLEHLRRYNWEIPKLVSSPEDLQLSVNQNLCFTPWGWSPAVYKHFSPFLPFVHPRWENHPFSKWNNHLADLLSRETGYNLLTSLSQIKSDSGKHYSLISLPEIPLQISRPEDLPDILKKLSPPLIIKTPFSASGRGLFRIRSHADAPENSQWVKGMLKKQGKIYIEKMLNKIQDVSFQFSLTENSIEYLGHNFFYTEASGQFAGCAIGEPENGSKLFSDGTRIKEAIVQAAELLKEGIKKTELNKKYTGPAGIDGIFFEDENGCLKLNPCLEINFRYNMGYANVLFKRKMHPAAKGKWKTGIFAKEEWQKFCRMETEKHPVQMLDGKPVKGFIPFVDPKSPKKFGAWLHFK
ncbi:MAG: hypothetical protein ACOC2E_09690 [Bacteroidota bacterium]